MGGKAGFENSIVDPHYSVANQTIINSKDGHYITGVINEPQEL